MPVMDDIIQKEAERLVKEFADRLGTSEYKLVCATPIQYRMFFLQPVADRQRAPQRYLQVNMSIEEVSRASLYRHMKEIMFIDIEKHYKKEMGLS
jgi:hypothetical protein